MNLSLIIPAYNSATVIRGTLNTLLAYLPSHFSAFEIIVVDDASTDGTATVAREAGARVISHPYNIGNGAAVKTGIRAATGDTIVLMDGDGQHNPRDVPRIFEVLRNSGCEMVIGSRFVDGSHPHTSFARSLGTRFFRAILRPILGRAVHDPTSGFVGVNRAALEVFSRSFPLEYPEIEALVVLQRRAFRFEEVPCRMRPRTAGRSSITAFKSLYYIIHVLLGVFVNVLKYEGRRRRLLRRRTEPAKA